MSYIKEKEYLFRNCNNCLRKLALAEKPMEELYKQKLGHEAALIEISRAAPEVFRASMQELANRGFEISFGWVLYGYSEEFDIVVKPYNAEITVAVAKIVGMAQNLGVEVRSGNYKKI